MFPTRLMARKGFQLFVCKVEEFPFVCSCQCIALHLTELAYRAKGAFAILFS
jgi:hypothetical protein